MKALPSKTSQHFNQSGACLIVEDDDCNDIYILASEIILIRASSYHNLTYISLSKRDADGDTIEIGVQTNSNVIFDCWQYAKATGKMLDLRPICNLDTNSRKATLLKRVKEYKPSTQHFTF